MQQNKHVVNAISLPSGFSVPKEGSKFREQKP